MASNNQFSIAVHLMAGLAYRAEESSTSTKLAESVNACPSFLRRTLSKLSKANLIHATTGKTGTCSLAKEPAKISLLDIYRAVGAPQSFAIHHYPIQENCAVSRNIKPAMQKVLTRAQKSMEADLAKTSLADFVSDLEGR
jgi:Rrf2 family protein